MMFRHRLWVSFEEKSTCARNIVASLIIHVSKSPEHIKVVFCICLWYGYHDAMLLHVNQSAF